MTEPLLTAEQVAERLGVTRAWVWAQVRADAIPHVRLGRYRRFRQQAIDQWIAHLERGGEPERIHRGVAHLHTYEHG